MKLQKEHPLVDRIQTSTPERFLDELRNVVSKELVGPFPEAQTVYCLRGISDAKHDLVPRSLRERTGRVQLLRYAVPATIDKMNRLKVTAADANARERVTQFALELGVLVAFCRNVHLSGLRQPRFDFAFNDLIRDPNGLEAYLWHQQLRNGARMLSDWPPEELLPLLALAQHYGLPTRLLDWTRDLNTAAYFAASAVVTEWVTDDFKVANSLPKGKLAVWAFPESAARLLTVRSGYSAHGPLFMPMPPYDENPNLQAQRGVFTVWNDGEGNLCDRRPLPDLIYEWSTRHHIDLTGKLRFTRVELPKKKAPRLLDLLIRLGWDASRLFPGYGGAANAAIETAKIDLLLKRRPERHV
jgi:hypothetical protein